MRSLEKMMEVPAPPIVACVSNKRKFNFSVKKHVRKPIYTLAVSTPITSFHEFRIAIPFIRRKIPDPALVSLRVDLADND
jgi:hypothetical protein